MSWIRYQLGTEAMARYFSTNRPVWGLLYQLTTRLFPQVPIYWQVFALFLRWLTGLLVWATMRELFPKRTRLALSIALLFLLYPGFNQQSGAYLYSHFFIVLNFLIFSYYLMLRAARGRYWLKTGFGMLFSALNLWMHEYFFVLELMRPAVIWTSLREEDLDFRARLRRTLGLWAPYLAVFVAAVLSRLFIFNNQIYEIGGSQAGSTPFNLLTTIPASLWTVTVAAWSQVFRIPDLAVDGPRTTLVYGAITLVTYGVVIAALFWKQAGRAERSDKKDAYLGNGIGPLHPIGGRLAVLVDRRAGLIGLPGQPRNVVIYAGSQSAAGWSVVVVAPAAGLDSSGCFCGIGSGTSVPVVERLPP